jgi:hypothetical protein
MADVELLLRALAEFLGTERFRKFVQAGCVKGRMRYWQEKAWAKFTSAHPEIALPLDELEVSIRICHIHGRDLLSDFTPVERGCIDYTQEYIQVMREKFPRAATQPVMVGKGFSGDRIQVWFCPECREAEAEWFAKRNRRQR